MMPAPKSPNVSWRGCRLAPSLSLSRRSSRMEPSKQTLVAAPNAQASKFDIGARRSKRRDKILIYTFPTVDFVPSSSTPLRLRSTQLHNCLALFLHRYLASVKQPQACTSPSSPTSSLFRLSIPSLTKRNGLQRQPPGSQRRW